MAMATSSATNLSTKSIDVGSMFLLDVSLHESDINSSDQSDVVTLEQDFVFPGASSNQHQHNYNQISPPLRSLKNSKKIDNYAIMSLKSSSIAQRQRGGHHQHDEHVSSSLERLADAIDNDGQFSNNSHDERHLIDSVTIVEPQPPPEIAEHQPSSSLSDESFGGDSLSASFSASSEDAEDEERGSTTTREDSGVLDMKDLDSQLNNSYDHEEHNEEICHDSQQIQENPISSKSTATNLINKSAVSITNNRPSTKPTKSNNSNNHHHHHNNNHDHHLRNQSRRSVSASLPIQVPVRQMKKDLNKLKLGLINKEMEQPMAATANISNGLIAHENENPASYEFHDDNNHLAGVDDFDEFLEQEYNDNHQNHYPIDEFDMEPLRAEENPMKLFESIQALARSLHEDTELFGSLPPKRIFDESPIRSLAFA